MPPNEDLAFGNSFLTEVKTVGKKDSRTNMGMGLGRGSTTNVSPNINDNVSPSPNMTHMGFSMPQSGTQSPNSASNMLVSFNFLTQVPIDEFIQ